MVITELRTGRAWDALGQFIEAVVSSTTLLGAYSVTQYVASRITPRYRVRRVTQNGASQYFLRKYLYCLWW